MPTVSVIIPNYNHARFLTQRVESVLEQSYQDFELILLDDCSSDGSREILESYRDNAHVSHIVYNDINSGSAFKQWNKGIALAKGEWIWIAESDDWADPQFLKTIVEGIKTHPKCGLAYCLSYMTDEEGHPLWEITANDGIKKYDGKRFVTEKLVLTSTIMNVSSCVFRKELFKPEKQTLYEHMRLCGDWFFYMLLAEQTDVLKVRKPLNYCRRHGDNIAESADAKGLTFLEGSEILDYILKRYHVKKTYYSKFWGRQWAKYQKKWHFTKDVNLSILHKFIGRHRLIVLFYIIYRFKLWLR